MATKPETSNDIKVDPNALYLEEIFTDRRVGTIRRLTPVKKGGERDAARPVIYQGETQVLTPAGALPIGFEIGAGSLEEAAEKFGQLAREAIERTVKELQELRRQAASQIVVPQGPLPPVGPGVGGIEVLSGDAGDAREHVLELVVVDLGAGERDLAVHALPSLERHARREERAIAALGELAGAHAERAVLVLVAVADRGERVLLRPGLERLGIQLRRARGTQLVVEVGEGAIVAVLGAQAVDRIEYFVPIDGHVDVGAARQQVLQLAEDHAAAVVLAHARAPELLEALPAQPEEIGLARALWRGPVGAHDFGFAGPERGGGADQAADIRGGHGVNISP